MPLIDGADAVYFNGVRRDRAYLNGTAIPLPLRKRGNSASYVQSPRQVYLGMWGVFIPQNAGLIFTCDMLVFPDVFPAETVISWNVTPDPGWGGLSGYLAMSYGNYDDNAVSTTPRQVYTITGLSMLTDWTFTGDAASGLLCECWLTATQHTSGATSPTGGDPLAEVGFLPKVSASAQSYFNSLTNVGSFTDTNGAAWNVHKDTSVTPTYFVAVRSGFTSHQGALDFKDYFAFLIGAGQISGNEWFNGLAFGVEPKSGVGSLTINNGMPVTYAGAARVPWTITSLAAAAQSSTQINLSWTAAPGATSHQYRVNGGTWTNTSGPSSQSVTGLTASTAYTFEVRGVNATGNAAQSNTASATTNAPATSNVISNGAFASNTVWSGAGFSGKTISGGTANFVSSPTFDGFNQAVTVTAGKYYEMTWTISGRTSGEVYPYLSGGTGVNGTHRTSNGTFTERLLVGTGNNNFGFQLATSGTLSVDNVSLIGPYNTSTVGGA